jgi:hypothetical protein
MPDEMTMSLSAIASPKAEWAVLMTLGAFHGINPGMGWLFAVALGMQERRRGAVFRALVSLGAGHALAVTSAVAVALIIGAVIPPSWLRWMLSAVLVGLGLFRFRRHRHPRCAGLRVGMGRLALWSFLMATAHGAGLMVMPMFVGTSMAHEGGHVHHMVSTAPGVGTVLLATGVHAVGYLAVTGFIALLVFEKLGVGILRHTWINLDVIWAAALLATGALTLML